MTPLVGQLVAEIGANYVGIRTLSGEVERFDGRTVIRWSPLAPQPSPAAKYPDDWEKRRAHLPKPRQIGR